MVEAFTILPRHERAAAAIEYKGLSANGVETAWLAAGSVCGTTGRNTPLLGFAVRQKAGVAGARFDCEYSGSFESGAVSGPARNGAPCGSVSDTPRSKAFSCASSAAPAPPHRELIEPDLDGKRSFA